MLKVYSDIFCFIVVQANRGARLYSSFIVAFLPDKKHPQPKLGV